MRFGVIKTLIENKLVESFVNKRLSTDMSFFQDKILKDKSFKKHMFVYDTLNENKSLDSETANYLIDDLINDLKNNPLSENVIKTIKRWTNGIVKENNYSVIDNLVYGDDLHPEKKSIARKQIVESLGKNKVIKESKSKIPLKSMVKIANTTIAKKLENLSESDKEKILKVLKSDDEIKEEFKKLKEDTLNKIDRLISESPEDLTQTLIETKERLGKSDFSKKEYIKLINLNDGLVL
jgi:tellurite resistance protein